MLLIIFLTGLERNQESCPHIEDCGPCCDYICCGYVYVGQHRLLRCCIERGNALVWQYCGCRLLQKHVWQTGRESHVGLRGSLCIRKCFIRHLLARSKYVFPRHSYLTSIVG